MKIRAAVLTGMLAIGLTAGSSLAAPNVCFLIADDKGDVTLPSNNLDIVSADVGTSAKSITAVIRVAALAAELADSTAPTGYAFNFRFSAPGSDTPLYLLGSIQPGALAGTAFEFGWMDGNFLTKTGDAKGVIDQSRNEVRITAPLAFGGRAKLTKGAKITNLQAITQRRFVVLLSGSDSTVIDEKKTHTVGTSTCVVHA